MTALVWALGVGLVLATGACVTLAMLSRKDSRALVTASDLLAGVRAESAEWESKHRTTAAKLVVVADSAERERFLRVAAETRANVARARLADEIRKRIPTATNEEIQEITNDTFSALSIAPRPVAGGVPQAVPRRSEDGADRLIDPWAEVQPAKPAG